MQHLIRWKRSDYMKLSKAVSRFNKLLTELDVDFLPEYKKYSDVKNTIVTRAELNRVINSLKRATLDNLSKVKTYTSGEKISDWEYKELNKAKKRALKNLENEKNIITERPSIGMGDFRITEIEAIENSINKINQKVGKDFNKLKERIFSVGRTDLKLSKEKLFMDNFYKALEGISNFQNYELLKKELDKIKNPTKFYEYVKRSPILMDLFLWYKEANTTAYGSFKNNAQAFDFTLFYHLGIESDFQDM